MITAGLGEGVSVGQIGRIPGISRQPAARYAKGLRAPA
jgi:hypothetical protein